MVLEHGVLGVRVLGLLGGKVHLSEWLPRGGVDGEGSGGRS
jgi:hypothetical protein